VRLKVTRALTTDSASEFSCRDIFWLPKQVQSDKTRDSANNDRLDVNRMRFERLRKHF